MKITIVGDIMCEPLMIKAAKKQNGYDFGFVFHNIKELFSEADFVVGNLETPLAGKKAKYTKELFSFNAPEEFGDAIKDAGISLVTTANNHCLDRGFQGMLHTLEVLDTKGIAHVGTWKNADNDRQEAYYFEKEGQKVAIVTSCYGTNYSNNHCKLTEEEERHINLLHSYKEPVYERTEISLVRKILNVPFRILNSEQKVWVKKILHMTYNTPREDSYLDEITAKPYVKRFVDDIEKAKRNADVVIPYLHVGGQFNIKPGKFTKYIFEKAQNAGSDLVIASHPHIVQEARVFGNVPCLYSIGNFSMSPNSMYLLHENLPAYGLAVHLYIFEKKLQSVSFTILKIVEEKEVPLTVYCVDDYINNLEEEEKKYILEEVSQIFETVTQRKFEGIQREYELWSNKNSN